jgi:hypothetical protein
MQLRRKLAGARTDKEPSSAAEGLRAGRQRNAVFAVTLLAAPPVRGRPMETDIARLAVETRFKADGGGFLASIDRRPSQRARDPSAGLQPSGLEKARQIERKTILNGWPPA